ncbi:MAG: hypothetical protein NC204_02235 [Candidatus Amulumruptor caecigallinarius]|nr:hypothetical protein [Candidatus Amulumruptor caecigallinarius]
MKPGKLKIFKWSILALLTGYMAVMAVWANTEAHKHVCTGMIIEVEGNTPLGNVIQRGVKEELRGYPTRIVGTPLHNINTVEIERYLTSLSNFESVSCMITSRGELLVKIVPLIPVMRVFFADNSYYINKEGRHIESNAEFFSDVPVVTGRFNRNFQPKDLLPVVNYLKNDGELREIVSMINAEDPHNIMLIPRIRGHVVNIGDTTDLSSKKHALMLFYKEVIPYKGWEEYDTISVKFKGQVVATRRDKSKLNHSEEYIEEEDLEEGTLPEN